jgi:hypothetical protein
MKFLNWVFRRVAILSTFPCAMIWLAKPLVALILALATVVISLYMSKYTDALAKSSIWRESQAYISRKIAWDTVSVLLIGNFFAPIAMFMGLGKLRAFSFGVVLLVLEALLTISVIKKECRDMLKLWDPSLE